MTPPARKRPLLRHIWRRSNLDVITSQTTSLRARRIVRRRQGPWRKLGTCWRRLLLTLRPRRRRTRRASVLVLGFAIARVKTMLTARLASRRYLCPAIVLAILVQWGAEARASEHRCRTLAVPFEPQNSTF